MSCRQSAIALLLSVAAAGITLAQTANPTTTVEDPFRAEIERYVSDDKVALPAPCQVLFVGSSSIVHWKETLAADMAPMPVINRGFGGSQIEDVNRWFNETVAPYHPRAIVFYAGENDIDAGKSVEKVVADFDQFMTLKTRALGKTPVYFISIKPSPLRSAQLPLQHQVNAAIHARVQRRKDLHYIDVAALMMQNGKSKDIFSGDGLHMTSKGYAIWSVAVRAAMLPRTNAEAGDCRRRDKP